MPRYIATVETAKHRVFQFLDSSIRPDNKLVAIALSDAFHLGVLSSRMHVRWALAAGGWLGVGNDPVYVKSRCFETFPFPDENTGLTPNLMQRIRRLAEQIDSHRKAQQASSPDVTITGMYNVLEKLRSSKALNAREKVIHERGLVAVLRSLHDDLDAAVLAAYGWDDLSESSDGDTLLQRLVELNAKRAGEEAGGLVRWLRPELQQGALLTEQTALPVDVDEGEPPAIAATVPITARKPWPSGLPEQIKAVANLLATTTQPLSTEAIASGFNGRGRWRSRLPTILETLEALGRAHRADSERWQNSRG